MEDLEIRDNQINVTSGDDKAYEALSRIVNSITTGAEVKKAFSDECYTIFEISKADPAIIIGKHGHTLDAIQSLINMVVKKEKKLEIQKLYLVDIDGYRKRREISLRKYAREKAKIAKQNREPVALYFMNSIERRLVHVALKEDPEVTTASEGKEPYRRIIISPSQVTRSDDDQVETI